MIAALIPDGWLAGLLVGWVIVLGWAAWRMRDDG